MRLRYQLACTGAAAAALFAAGVLVGRDRPAQPQPLQAPAAQTAMSQADFDRRAAEFISAHGDQLDQSIGQYRAEQARRKQEQAHQTVRDRHHDIYDDPEMPSAGNPAGDVTIVEFFDFRCPYCKASAPELEHLLESDPGIRIVWRDMPILGEESVYLSHLALAAAEHGRYHEFYTAVFAKLPGHASRAQADEVVRGAGFDPQQLEAESHTDKIEGIIKRNLDLARTLAVNGTPGWIIGDQLLPGALTEARLAQLIADLRKPPAADHS